MRINRHNSLSRNVIGLVFGLVTALGVIGPASAASDYKVISKYKISMGEWQKHKPWRVIRFYLPESFDYRSDVVLQMNVSSTNKSRYSAIYLNPYEVPGSEYDGCDSVKNDRNERERIDFLPIVPHKKWQMYHRTIDGRRLQPGDNYLLVCSRNTEGGGSFDLENFYLKDIVLHYRTVKPAPEFCPSVYEPVCGVDGQTYSNACEAESARVEIRHTGEC